MARKTSRSRSRRKPQTMTPPQSAAPQSEATAMMPTPREGSPEQILDMQRSRGNQAVMRHLRSIPPGEGTGMPPQAPLLAHSNEGTVTRPAQGADSNRVQRIPPIDDAPPTIREKKAGPTWEESLEVFKALSEILQVPKGYHQVFFETGEGTIVARGFPAAYKKSVPDKYMNILYQWYDIARGGNFVEVGPPMHYEGSLLLEKIKKAKAATAPFAKALLAEGDAKTQPYLQDVYYKPIGDLVVRGHKEEAEQAISSAGETLSKLTSPDDADKKEKAKRAIAQAINVMSTVSGQVNSFTGQGIGDAYQKIMDQMDTSSPVAQNLKGMQVGVAVGHINDVLGALKAISDISDPEYAKKMFDKKMSGWGYVAAGADLTGNIVTILQGTVSGVTGVTAALSTALGHADEAAKLLAQSSKITGTLGNVVAVLTIAKGVAVLCDENATETDKVMAGADIAGGTAALLASAGIISSAAASGVGAAVLSFKLSVAIIEKGVMMSRALIGVDLRKAFETLKTEGHYLATWGNQVVAANTLIEQASDPTKKAYLKANFDKKVDLLRSTLTRLIKYSTTEQKSPSQPGYWEELRKRFGGHKVPKEAMFGIDQKLWDQYRMAVSGFGEAPGPNTPVEEVVKQTQHALELIAQAFKDYEKILDQETHNAWRDHG